MPKLRKVAILPSLFTLGNGICGFASIIVASRIHPSALYLDSPAYHEATTYLGIAGWLIIAGMIFDVFDGRFARLSNTTSRFGAELDSLCDAISFGAAPAFLLLKLGPTPERETLYATLFVAATFYVICTILRLARFNVETGLDDESHRSFKGLPSPAAAGCIASVAIMRQDLRIYQQLFELETIHELICTLLPFGAIILGVLMVSNLVYPHLVNQSLRGRRSFQHLVELLLLVILVILIRELMVALAFWGFALMGPVRALVKLSKQEAEGMAAS